MNSSRRSSVFVFSFGVASVLLGGCIVDPASTGDLEEEAEAAASFDFPEVEAADVDQGKVLREEDTGGASGGTSGSSCSCVTYPGPCTNGNGNVSTVQAESFTWTVTGPNKYAWMTVCGSCSFRYVAGQGAGFCLW